MVGPQARHAFWSAFRLVLIAFWCGLTWTVGYVVAPTLFQLLDDRALAGTIAGALFRIQAFASLGLGALLIALCFANAGPRDINRVWWKQADVRIVLAMLVTCLLGYFSLQPMMHAARLAMAAGDASAHARFSMFHGVSSLAYLVQSVLGLWLLVRQASPKAISPANATS